MKLDDFERIPKREKRTIRINLRIHPSQWKFMDDKGLLITDILDKALEELGHKIPEPSEIEPIAMEVARKQGNYKGGKRGKGNIPAQRHRRRLRGKR